jgi:hypothetical protein
MPTGYAPVGNSLAWVGNHRSADNADQNKGKDSKHRK